MGESHNSKTSEEHVIKAGLRFLERCKSVDVTSLEHLKVLENEDPSNELTVKDLECILLISAVKERSKTSVLEDSFDGCCELHNDDCKKCDSSSDTCIKSGCSKCGWIQKRRGAVSEKNLLERDGLVSLLKKYRAALRLKSCCWM